MTIDQLLSYTPYAIMGAAFVAAGILYARLRRGEKMVEHLEGREFVTLKVMVPKNNEKGPLSAEQMFAAFHGIFRSHLPAQEHVSFEIAADGHAIQFYVFLPRHLKDYVESQMYAQYPHVEITEVADYAFDVDVTPTLQAAGTTLKLLKEEFFPIKTFPNFEVDPLAGITGVLSNVAPGERIWIQYLIEPADDSWIKAAAKYVKAVRKGLDPNPKLDLSIGAVMRGLTGFGAEAIGQVMHGPPKPKEGGGGEKPAVPTLSGPEEQGIKSVETKVTKLGFRTLIRIVALAPALDTAKSKVLNLVGAFKQFNASNINGFSATDLVVDRTIFDAYRRRTLAGGYTLNVEELASVFHLPHVSVETPTIVWAGSKKGEPPQNLPIEGTVDANEITLFGETNFRHMNQRFGIKLPDRRYHTYSVGKTGTGKSTLIENMVIDDIYKGRGVAVVDPHGDLIKRILQRMPSHRINDVVYFNPADRDYPIAFNLLEKVEQDLKGIVASGLMSIFTKLWSNVWSARMEYILRNTVLAALDYPDSTLLSVMKILNDPTYRKHVIAKITDPVIKDFFLNEFEKYDPKFRQEAIAPIQNKVGQFLSSATMRNILGQPHSTIDFGDIMNSGKILLVNLSIGEIGEDASALLGGMVITKIQLTAMRRATVPEEERKDFYLYVDEFQNFATDSFAVILSEARKYRLNLFMTNQFMAQMPDTVKNAVFGNVGTIIAFRVGPQDAGVLVKEFEPVFEANDLVNLSNYQIYIKMTIDGVTSVPFSAVTIAPVAEVTGNDQKVIQGSRERYTRPREFVERKIAEWQEFWEKLSREEARADKERRRAAKGFGPHARGEPTTFRRSDRPGAEPRRDETRRDHGRAEQSGYSTPPVHPDRTGEEKKEAPKSTPSTELHQEAPKLATEAAKSVPRYIPPPPLRRLTDDPKKSEPMEDEKKITDSQQIQKSVDLVGEHVSPSMEEEAKYVEPIEPKPLIKPEELPQAHKKDRSKVPAFGSRGGEIVPLKEGEEIRLDE